MPEAQGALIDVLPYLPLVERIAARLAGAPNSGLGRDDLVAAGVCGLLESSQRYDGRVPFAAYAQARIEGAIRDEIRAYDWRGRRGREHAAEEARARGELAAELEREPTAAEMSDRTGRDEASAGAVIALTDVMLELVGDPADEAVPPERATDLARAIGRLSEREQQVLSLVYAEGLSHPEAAAVLGISSRRVTHLHTAALVKLRHLMRGWARAG